jgi:hypothetical protein
MTYSDHQFGFDRLAQLDQGYDPIRLTTSNGSAIRVFLIRFRLCRAVALPLVGQELLQLMAWYLGKAAIQSH